jgi:hypothetical protein
VAHQVQVDLGLEVADGLAVQVERIPEQSLAGRHRHRRGVLRDVVSQFQRGRQHIRGVEHPAAQPQLHRPMSVESCSRQKDFGRVGDAHQPRQHPVRVGITDDAPPDLHHPVARVGGEEPDVALEGQRQAQADGVAVDGGDHRLGERPCGHVEPGRAETRPRFGEGLFTAPVSTITRTESSRSQVRKASASSSRIPSPNALRHRGRLSVMVATPPSTVVSNVR